MTDILLNEFALDGAEAEDEKQMRRTLGKETEMAVTGDDPRNAKRLKEQEFISLLKLLMEKASRNKLDSDGRSQLNADRSI